MAYIDTSVTSTSIYAMLKGLDSSYSYNDRVCTWYLNGVRKGTTYLSAKVSSGGGITFSELASGITYYINVIIDSPHMSSSVELETQATTDRPYITPWSWYSSNGSASAWQTQTAFNAIRNKGNLSDFSYLVWNDLVDKVKEVQESKGVNWLSEFASYSATRMSYSDKQLTATRFNSLRFNIGAYYSTGINTVNKGDIIYGSYFNILANCINYWINE